MRQELPESRATLDTLSVNTIRALCMDAVQKANSGHPGAPMGLAPAAYALWSRYLKHNPADPAWPDRDRFVLSGGHASSLLYAMLHLTGYDLSLEDIRNFRQWGSRTPGHPEYGHTPGVETTTGPLGQGVANAVGMAMAERHMAARFNRRGHDIVDHYTYVMCGDGDLMEGIAQEAISLAGHLRLSKLICLYDDNRISIEGETAIAFTENVGARFEACGWRVIRVADGNDIAAISEAISEARRDADKPTLIMLRTLIAYGSPNKQGLADAHGSPLGIEEVRLTKRFLGCPEDEDFCVPDQPVAQMRSAVEKGADAQRRWEARLADYREAFPELAAQWDAALNRTLAPGWRDGLPDFAGSGPVATRSASGKALNLLAARVPELFGGSADLAPSNKTIIDASHDFQAASPDGRNIRFGVREHAMAAICSGMALHGGPRPYCGTFLVFADYMRPAIRLTALMRQPVIYVFTHDSLAVGEDGPTHQPVEHLASLRLFSGLTVIRPADAAETVTAWEAALENTAGPTALILSRQKLPVLDRAVLAPADGLKKGAYALKDVDGKADITLIATGSEVHIALAAADTLAEKGVAARVVNMPSWELFEAMPDAYKKETLPDDGAPRLAVEAGHPMGWERYLGGRGDMIGVTGFGASAPGGQVMARFGFTAENVTARALALLGKQGPKEKN